MGIWRRAPVQLVQILGLLILIVSAWHILHKPVTTPSDIYPYLTSLSPTLVNQCQAESAEYVLISWEDNLAIRSTLSEHDAQQILGQLLKQIRFKDLDWSKVPANAAKDVQRHREILKQYPYFKPHTYLFPVQGTTWFEDSFGADREGGLRRHQGTDLFSPEGTPIVNVCSGKIEQLGWNRLGGERVGVRGDDGNYYYYAHLQFISPQLSKGHRIEAGEILGGMGHTGDALTTPDHLHFGIELGNGEWINPYPFLAVWQGWSR